MTKRNIYTKEFKLEAVRLLESSGKPGGSCKASSGGSAQSTGTPLSRFYRAWFEYRYEKDGNAGLRAQSH